MGAVLAYNCFNRWQAVKEVRFFQGVGPVADTELELHFRLCGGIIVVASRDQLAWSKLIRTEAVLYTPYTLNSLRTLPRLTLVGALSASQLAGLYNRARAEFCETTVIDVRRSISSMLRA